MQRLRLLAACLLLGGSLLSTGCVTNCCLLTKGAGCGACLDGCGGEIGGCEMDGCAAADCGCAAEPSCGCGGACGHKSMALQKWTCGPCDGPKICVCTGPQCGPQCGPGGCGPSCGCEEPQCGCEEPACGCEEPACGCEPACGGDGGCGQACGGKKRLFGRLLSCFSGCGGCDKELYWSEWHNDPPRCCDPCDKCGNWVGPGAGYRAPYAHPYGP